MVQKCHHQTCGFQSFQLPCKVESISLDIGLNAHTLYIKIWYRADEIFWCFTFLWCSAPSVASGAFVAAGAIVAPGEFATAVIVASCAFVRSPRYGWVDGFHRIRKRAPGVLITPGEILYHIFFVFQLLSAISVNSSPFMFSFQIIPLHFEWTCLRNTRETNQKSRPFRMKIIFLVTKICFQHLWAFSGASHSIWVKKYIFHRK